MRFLLPFLLVGCVEYGQTKCTTERFNDLDGDGFGDPETGSIGCIVSGYSANDFDCDDTDHTRYPSAPESCNKIDDDCDGEADESEDIIFVDLYPDADGDGYGAEGAAAESSCDPNGAEGYSTTADDCDDTDADINPGVDDDVFGDGVQSDCEGWDGDLPLEVSLDDLDVPRLYGEDSDQALESIIVLKGADSDSVAFLRRADLAGTYPAAFEGKHYTSEAGAYESWNLSGDAATLTLGGDLAPIGDTGDGTYDALAIVGDSLIQLFSETDGRTAEVELGITATWAARLDDYIISGDREGNVLWLDPRSVGEDYGHGYSALDVGCPEAWPARTALVAQVTGSATSDLVLLGADSRSITVLDGDALAAGDRCDPDVSVAATYWTAESIESMWSLGDISGDSYSDLAFTVNGLTLILTGDIYGFDLDLAGQAAATVEGDDSIVGAVTWETSPGVSYVGFLVPNTGEIPFVEASRLLSSGGGKLNSSLVTFRLTSDFGLASWALTDDVDRDGRQDLLLGDGTYGGGRGVVYFVLNSELD